MDRCCGHLDCDCAEQMPRDPNDPGAYPGPDPDCECDCHECPGCAVCEGGETP